jgi:hypothetical protein
MISSVSCGEGLYLDECCSCSCSGEVIFGEARCRGGESLPCTVNSLAICTSSAKRDLARQDGWVVVSFGGEMGP